MAFCGMGGSELSGWELNRNRINHVKVSIASMSFSSVEEMQHSLNSFIV